MFLLVMYIPPNCLILVCAEHLSNNIDELSNEPSIREIYLTAQLFVNVELSGTLAKYKKRELRGIVLFSICGLFLL